MEEKAPFVFGVPASGVNFTDRVKETERLMLNFKHGINTVLISPRRWGKTSLVRKAAGLVESDNLRIVYLDIFSCRNEWGFYHRFSSAVIKATSSKLEEWIANARKFLSRLYPKFSFGTDPMNDFSISLEISDTIDSADDVLQLPEKIAKEKGIRIVVCIDEFQQVGQFPNSEFFQKRLRSIWQLQECVSYCLFGSKRHLMHEIFDSSKQPFYKFGDIINLDKIPTPDWVTYITSQFQNSGKVIAPELATEICNLVDNNSSYVQQLSWLVWSTINSVATEADLDYAFNLLLDQNSSLFEKMTEDLSTHQLSFLRAMVDGVKDGFSNQAVIKKYNLGSSANVRVVQKALEKKEIIYIDHRRPIFTDPIFPIWLKRHLLNPA
ncbi:MAG: ATP-binding protein [Bacteroidales bacterium]|nr:ATP-binding protein [Bacteroidales bacterium]